MTFALLALLFVPQDRWDPGPLNAALASTSREVRGDDLCDPKKRRRQFEKFQAMYGARIRRLEAAYAAWHGPDPEFVVVSTCRTGGGANGVNKHLDLKLKRFDKKLLELESFFSLPR